MVGLLLAAALSWCTPQPVDTDRGWASWYASPLRSHHTYNNPWYTRGLHKVLNYAAVKSFHFGDPTYSIKVCAVKTKQCVIARVVDHCSGCTGKRLVDLSPILFDVLGIPRKHGVMKITMRRVNVGQGSDDCRTASR